MTNRETHLEHDSCPKHTVENVQKSRIKDNEEDLEYTVGLDNLEDIRSVERKPGEDRPRSTTTRDHHLSNIVRCNMDTTASRPLVSCIRPQKLEFQG
ncbi:hypothetical protein TNCV_4705461 [Trichonephila clavipes]|nr:hypothetical protein TNCV_4705461 [Trichonephila clavipes]